MIDSDQIFDRDYFENGLATGKSCFFNYSWMPELTIPLAYRMIRIVGIQDGETILDFGSAKGFLVHAFRLLGFEAYGTDISRYAIENAHEKVRKYNRLFEKGTIPFDFPFDWVISKDTLEHIPYSEIDGIIELFCGAARKGFFLCPLGQNGKYVIPQYDTDSTHQIREPAEWWIDLFQRHGLEVVRWSFDVTGLKDNWKNFHQGNAFFQVINPKKTKP